MKNLSEDSCNETRRWSLESCFVHSTIVRRDISRSLIFVLINNIYCELLGTRLKLVGMGLPGLASPWLLMSLNTAGVPIENPIMSNMFMCFKNSMTLEHEAQKGPQLFFPFSQHLGYPPPKQRPIPLATAMTNESTTSVFKRAMFKGLKRINMINGL